MVHVRCVFFFLLERCSNIYHAVSLGPETTESGNHFARFWGARLRRKLLSWILRSPRFVWRILVFIIFATKKRGSGLEWKSLKKIQGNLGEGEILFHLARRMSKLGGSHLVAFQMALFWLINGGDPNHFSNWDDPPRRAWEGKQCHILSCDLFFGDLFGAKLC